MKFFRLLWHYRVSILFGCYFFVFLQTSKAMNMKKRLLLCMVMLNLVTAVFSQNAKAMLIADSLTSVSLYDDNGWGGTPLEWTLQERINEVASNDDLVALARSHRNGAARAVAFRLLVARGDSRYRDILRNSLNDTNNFSIQAFDVIYPGNVADYMVNVLVEHWDFQSLEDSIYLDSLFHSQPELMKSRSRLYESFVKSPTVTDFRRIFTPEDSVTLDSMLFFTPNMQHIDRLYTILDNLPADECYYDRLHQMFYDEGIAEALSNLCRYRRDEDKAAVIECLLEYSKGLDKEHAINGPEGRTNQGLEAVAIWPDTTFLPALRKVRDYEVARKHYDYGRIRLFYSALMAYDDENSYNFIDETLRMSGRDSSTRHYHLEYFRKAYDMSPNNRYESLLNKYDEIP